jgi:hypothetical protein
VALAIYFGLVTAVQLIPAVVMRLSGHRTQERLELMLIAVVACGSALVANMIVRAVSRMPRPESNLWADLDLGQ